MSFLMRSRIAVAEHTPAVDVLTWLEIKYLSSKMPRGVHMYFLVVTREMVDSCMPTVSATSCSTSAFIASSPCSKNPRWRSTMQLATLSRVSCQLCRLFMNQRASCSWPFKYVLSWLRAARRGGRAGGGGGRGRGGAAAL